MACLVLGLWDEVIPNAKYIFVIREYKSVVLSLFNWEKSLYPKNGIIQVIKYFMKFFVLKSFLYNNYLKSWIAYNEKMIEFVENKSYNFLIIDLEDIYFRPENLVEMISKKFNINLNLNQLSKASEAFNPSKIESKMSSHLKFERTIESNAINLYNKLEKIKRNL